MATIAQPTVRAKYALVYDAPARIAKVNGGLYVLYEDDRIAPFTPQLALATVVLGDVAVADTQAMWDRINGGPVGICTSRPMLEV